MSAPGGLRVQDPSKHPEALFRPERRCASGLSDWRASGECFLAERNRAATDDALAGLISRVLAARTAFEALPRIAADPGTVPDPVSHEPLAA